MSNNHLKELLRSKELKATTARLNLLAEMQQYKTAMPYSAIQETFKTVDRVTLYRTLESLKEQGVIHMAFQENNEIYYAMCGTNCNKNQHKHDHLHFKCVQCEAVTCQKATKNLDISIEGYAIHKVTINIEGVCSKCS